MKFVYKSTFCILLLYVLILFPNRLYSQDTIRYNLGINTDKYALCSGDIATLTIQTCVPVNSSTPGYAYINTEDIRADFSNCHYVGCTVVNNVEPDVEGDGIISKEVTVRKGCSSDPTVLSTIVIKVKPTATTKYRISWMTKTIYSADPECGTEEFIGQVQSYNDSITIPVIQRTPPTLSPTELVLNQSSYYSGTITATADTFITNSREMLWYERSCGEDSLVEHDIFYNGNSIGHGIFPKNLGKMEIRAKKVDNGCISDLSAPAIVTVKPCRLFSSGCNQTDVNIIDGLSCDPEAEQRSDHHFYNIETTLCEGDDCNLNDIWQFYKSEQYHQVPILSDQVAALREQAGNDANQELFLSKSLFPEENYGQSITDDCNPILLPTPVSFAIKLGTLSDNGSIKRFFNEFVDNDNPFYADPVFLRVDETNKCVVNYTGEGHIFYPGKVTRCLVQECDKVKILTFGEGTTNFGENLFGNTLSGINQFTGKLMFENVDQRLIQDLNNKQKISTQNSKNNKLVSNNKTQLENKNWKIVKFDIKYNGSDSLTPIFSDGDTINFWNLKTINVDFSEGDIYKASDVLGGIQTGTWGFDSIKSIIRLDTTYYSIVTLDSNTLVIKGVTAVSKDSSFTTAEYYMTLINSSRNNSWIGLISPSWENSGNWSGGFIPNEYTNVIINSGTPYQPKLNSNTTIKSLTLKSLSRLEIKEGFKLHIVNE